MVSIIKTYNHQGWQDVLITIVLILYGNPDIGAHRRSNLCYLNCLRHLIGSRADFFLRQRPFFFMRVQYIQNYQLISIKSDVNWSVLWEITLCSPRFTFVLQKSCEHHFVFHSCVSLPWARHRGWWLSCAWGRSVQPACACTRSSSGRTYQSGKLTLTIYWGKMLLNCLSGGGGVALWATCLLYPTHW